MWYILVFICRCTYIYIFIYIYIYKYIFTYVALTIDIISHIGWLHFTPCPPGAFSASWARLSAIHFMLYVDCMLLHLESIVSYYTICWKNTVMSHCNALFVVYHLVQIVLNHMFAVILRNILYCTLLCCIVSHWSDGQIILFWLSLSHWHVRDIIPL